MDLGNWAINYYSCLYQSTVFSPKKKHIKSHMHNFMACLVKMSYLTIDFDGNER